MLIYSISFFWIVYASVLLPHVTSESQVVLMSTLHVGNISCPGYPVIFTCTVVGSRALSWGSNEYIGSGGLQLEFSTANRVDDRLNSTVDPDTFAILINVTNDGGTTLLRSELHIASTQSSVVSCLTVNNGSRQSINFTVLGESPPDVPQDAAATEFPSRRPDICLLLIDWDPPHDIDSLSIDHYIIRTSRESVISQITETTTLATFESPCNELTNLTINITAVDVCGGTSKPTANFIPTLAVTDPSDVTSTTSSMATTQAPAPTTAKTVYTLITTIVPPSVSVITLFITILAILTLCCYLRQKRICDSGDLEPHKRLRFVKLSSTADQGASSETSEDPKKVDDNLTK